MTEQEARKLFRSLAKPAEGSEIPTIVLYEGEAIEFAKAYAASEVAKTKESGNEFIDQRNHLSKKLRDARDSLAAKDKEIGELKAEIDRANCSAISAQQRALKLLDASKRLREGLEEISKAQEYEGFLLVSPALVENLLKNPAAGENPTVVDKNNS